METSGGRFHSFLSRHLCLLQLLTWEPRRDKDVSTVIVRPNFQDSVHAGYVTGLKKFTEYYTSVLCFTTPGDGPRSPPRAARTHEDSEFLIQPHPLFIELKRSANDIPAGATVIGTNPQRLLASALQPAAFRLRAPSDSFASNYRVYVNTFQMQRGVPAPSGCPAEDFVSQTPSAPPPLAAPGAVGHLSFTEILDTSLKVSWSEPGEKNGVLTGTVPGVETRRRL